MTQPTTLAEDLRIAGGDLQAILDHIPVRISYWTADLINRFANRIFEMHFGIEAGAAEGKHIRDVLGEEWFSMASPALEAALRGERRVEEFAVTLADGSPRYTQVDYVPNERAGQITGLYVTGIDLTAIRLLQDQLRQSEAYYREVTTLAAIGITISDSQRRCTYANPHWYAITGLAPGTGLGLGWEQVVPAPEQDKLRQIGQDLLHGRPQRTYTVQLRRPTGETRPRGEIRWVRVRGVALPPGDAASARYLLTWEDITELQESHEKIRELAQRLESVREDERRSVGLMLHEGIAQELFAARLTLQHLVSRAPVQADTAATYEELLLAIDGCMESLRVIANDLRPNSLAHLRLAVALEEHGRIIGARSGLRIEVREVGTFPELNETQQVACFRATQEALSNVLRHARATRVDIVLRSDGVSAWLEVTDDGVGVSKDAMAKPGSLGLLGMRERFVALGGGLTLAHRYPTGTTLLLHFPLTGAPLRDDR